MKSQEWQPREFHSNEAGDITLVDTKLVENGSMSHNSKVFPLRSEHGHIVRHGYVLIQDRQNQGETYIYDLDSGRVYFVHWTM